MNDIERRLVDLNESKRVYDAALGEALGGTYTDPVKQERRAMSEERAKLIAREAVRRAGFEDIEVQRLRLYASIGRAVEAE